MKRAPRMSSWVVVLSVLAIVGCEANRYEIAMQPADKSVLRELTCWRERTSNQKTEVIDFPKDELDRIAAAYKAAVPGERAQKHKFAGVFAAQMPNDVGGRGSYTHWESPLGSVSAYVERFRGNDDLLADVERRQQAADRIADLLIGWLGTELDDEAGFAELREFLEQRFRRDLKNLSLYGWAHDVAAGHDDDARPECLVRVGQYLIERAYFTPDQLPALTRAFQEALQDEPARLLPLLQRFLASKMGIALDQPIPPSLRFLSDRAVAEASISGYLRRTDEFQRLLKTWEQERATNPDAERPEPSAVLVELVARAFLRNVRFGRSDQLAVTLAATSEPFLTNGRWDEQAQQVRWSRHLVASRSDHSEFPALLYALWSQPDEPAQQAHFGRVVLAGRALASYCLWYRGLSEREATEWDEFVSSLRPSDDLPGRMNTFRFSHEPPARADETESDDLAAPARELILPGLTGAATAK